ncbi:BTB/POZ domain-containing protein [Striga asiatica]|uniref:BTB/POZ domain-containing protein n=1 Tax=Striga asiatica TaxID=4170 RepID=A0A5A7R4T9_STRAF|nr:BTB/POZ domain-containing protein [Striga asiatica]
MAEIRVPRVEQSQTKIKTVPIAVTPEGFWCCPSPTVFQKTLKTPQNPPNKSKPPPHSSTQQIPKKQTPSNEKKPVSNSSRTNASPDEQNSQNKNDPQAVKSNPSVPSEKSHRENPPKKVTIEFGEPGSSDLKVILLGKQGLYVKLSVHRRVLMEFSSFFASRISEQQQPVFPYIEIDNCEDVEIYVETIGLMYCRELKQRLMKQSVSRVLRILKAAQHLGFCTCIESCLEYLEAAPWVGQEEEDNVVSSVLSLESRGIIVQPVLKRVVTPEPPPHDTLSHVLHLVLTSRHEKGRREMKSTVLKLLKENDSSDNNSNNLSTETLYSSCEASLDSLISSFRQAASDANFDDDEVKKSIALEADNLVWLLDILTCRRSGDGFAAMWARQDELAGLHGEVAGTIRCHVSAVSSRVFVGIGRGEIFVGKEVRRLLLVTWLEPLMVDYGWLQGGWCRWFDRGAVEEGIGRTVLTLPLEDQQAVMMTWLGRFLRAGDGGCPNLQRAFEVWWRRAFGAAGSGRS